MARGRGSLADATGDAVARGEKGLWNSYPHMPKGGLEPTGTQNGNDQSETEDT
jgi:hypothetical protein